MEYLASSFSLQMLPGGGHLVVTRQAELPRYILLNVEEGVGHNDARITVCPNFVSYVGHEGTAKLLSQLLGYPVAVNRASVSLKVGDTLVVAQPVGNRLMPGQELTAPDLAYFIVEVKPDLDKMVSRSYDAGHLAGYREGNPHWLDEDEAKEDAQSGNNAPVLCGKCGKPINAVARIFGNKPDDTSECQCVP